MQLAHKQLENFQRNLKSLCSEHGSIQSIATAAKMTRAYVSNVANGKAVPSLESAARIADACELTLVEMLDSPKEFSKKMLAAT